MATPADPELLVFGLDKESANGSVEGLQRTWCDEQGRWPGDPACAAPAADQPRPGTFPCLSAHEPRRPRPVLP